MIKKVAPANNDGPPEVRRFFNTLAQVQTAYAHMLDPCEKGLKGQFNHYVRTSGNEIQTLCMPTDLSTPDGVRAAFKFSEDFENVFSVVIDSMNEQLDKSIAKIGKEEKALLVETGIDLRNATRISVLQNPQRVSHANLLRLKNLQTQMDKLHEIRMGAEDAIGEAFIPNYTRTLSI